MYSLSHSKFIIILSYLLEITLLGICLFSISCKIPFLPWSTPLTTYILPLLLILTAVQFLFFIAFWWLYDRHSTFFKLRLFAGINILFLMLMSLLSIMRIEYFQLSCYFFCLSMLILIYLNFKVLHAHLRLINQKGQSK